LSHQLDWSVLWQYRGLLIEGLIETIRLVLATVFVSLGLGIIIGLMRYFGAWPFRAVAGVYTEVFRNIPPLVQLFFWNFAVGLDVFLASWIGLAVFTSAYISEIVRSGLQATPKAQLETAQCSGMTGFQVIRHVMLPQALLRSLPALGIEFINVVKNSSIAMTIGYMELTFQTQQIEADTFRGFEAATAVTILYIMLSALIVATMYGSEALLKSAVKRA
jgi:polar amino acid transport system permease protein